MHKLKIFACFLTCLFLTACAEKRAVSEFSPAENEKLDALHAEIVDCAYSNLPKIDDGVSSDRKIAISVSLKCEEEYLAAYQFVADRMGLTGKKASEFMADAETTETKLRTYLSVVRRYREETAY